MNSIHLDVSKDMIMPVKKSLDAELLHPSMKDGLLPYLGGLPPASPIARVDFIAGLPGNGMMGQQKLPSRLRSRKLIEEPPFLLLS
jgi:hypothetical protein